MALVWGLPVSTEGLIFFFSPSQLNRPKVNKIVEILEKAKSCYWPALQNVYMNITKGELVTRPRAARSWGCLLGGAGGGLAPTPGGIRLPHKQLPWALLLRKALFLRSKSRYTHTAAPSSFLTTAGGVDFLSREHRHLFLFCAGLKEANDIVLYLKPLRILLEEMEQADFTVVCCQEEGHFAGAALVSWGAGAAGLFAVIRGVVPGSASSSHLGVPSWSCGEGRAEVAPQSTRGACLSPAPDLHCQGAVHHLLYLGHLRAL